MPVSLTACALYRTALWMSTPFFRKILALPDRFPNIYTAGRKPMFVISALSVNHPCFTRPKACQKPERKKILRNLNFPEFFHFGPVSGSFQRVLGRNHPLDSRRGAPPDDMIVHAGYRAASPVVRRISEYSISICRKRSEHSI